MCKTRTTVAKRRSGGGSRNPLDSIVPTENQKLLINSLNDEKPMVIALGPAGTGKTYISCTIGLDNLLKGRIDSLVITRPAVSVDEEHGFIPGSIDAKMLPWMMPLYDSFMDTVSKSMLENMIEMGTIQVCPLSYIRGRTFKNTWVIADEMQNATNSQMKALLTRIGENSRVIVSGDVEQSDLGCKNGLTDFRDRFMRYHVLSAKQTENNPNLISTNMIDFVTLEEEDVKRSEFVKQVLKVYDSM